jgi:hypothetical protein
VEQILKVLNWMVATSATTMALAAIAPATVMAQEVYVQGGTQGGGVGAALGLTSWAGVHADINGFNLSHEFHAGGNKFDGQLKVRHAGLYLDLFPFTSAGFRVTAGALFNRDRLDGTIVPENGAYKINGISVPASLFPGQTASVEARFPTVMPYLGLGWGHKPVSKGFGFVADIGVAYGKPSVDFNTPAGLAQLIPTQLKEEEDSIRNSIQKVKIFPIVQIGISYRF